MYMPRCLVGRIAGFLVTATALLRSTVTPVS